MQPFLFVVGFALRKWPRSPLARNPAPLHHDGEAAALRHQRSLEPHAAHRGGGVAPGSTWRLPPRAGGPARCSALRGGGALASSPRGCWGEMAVAPAPADAAARVARRDFFAGCVGGAASVIVGQPFDTVKVRVQADTTGAGARAVLLSTVRGEGVRALFKGTVAPTSTTALINAVVFAVKGAALGALPWPAAAAASFPPSHRLSIETHPHERAPGNRGGNRGAAR